MKTAVKTGKRAKGRGEERRGGEGRGGRPTKEEAQAIVAFCRAGRGPLGLASVSLWFHRVCAIEADFGQRLPRRLRE